MVMFITFVLLILGLRHEVEFALNDVKSFNYNSVEAFASTGRHKIVFP